VSTPCITWQTWAPPLDPPTAGGLDATTAQCIADTYWSIDAHLCAALQWEAYAATLPPTPVVAAVATGSQSVTYSPAQPGGDYGLALQRAAWHRSFVTGQVLGIPMQLAPPPMLPARELAWWEVSQPQPLAAFTWSPAQPAANTWVTLDGSTSAGGGGTLIVRYDWSGAIVTSSAGPVVQWQPTAPGSYTITLTVTDENGGQGSASQVVVVS